MSEQVTLLPEEVTKLQSFQLRFRSLTSQYGEAYFQQKLIGNELKEIDSQMDLLEDERISYMQDLQTKYGVGTVNINSGEFVPATMESVSPPNSNA